MYKKLLIAIFVICNILLSQVSFTDINAGLESGYGTAIWGDYGNDGYQDVLHFGAGDPINYLTYFTKLYRNDQNGGFEDITNHNLSNIYSTQGGAEWGDYDNDGDLDILLSGRTDDNNDISRIYRNDSGVFTDINAGLTGVSNGKVAWGDLDNDGDLDIVLTGKTTVQISKIYRNDSGIFTDIYAGLIGVEGGSVSLGDYDNDSDLDILLTGGTGSNYITKIYRNDTGLFTDINAGLPETDGSTSYHAEWGDYDNDGDLDILFSGQINMVYRNDNYDTFTDINVKLTYEWPSNGTCTVKIDKAEWGDCNNDGKLDILATGIGIPPHPSWSEFTAILINTGNDTFNDVYSNGNNNDGTDNTILSTRSGSASWCDYDKDGDLDFWINGIHTYEPYNYYCTAEIYKNNSSISNTSPTPPTNLYSSLNGNDVTLHWNTSTDAETPQNGLSYNLYIGTASGSCNILSPMSNTSNGYRKVSKRGNVDQINSWTIKDLPDGIYFYSVQAIDHVFAGSSFSPECIFVKGYTVLPENTSIVVGAGSEIRFFEGSETNCASNTILTIQDDGSLYSDGASITGDNADTWQGIVAEIGSSIILTHSVVKNAETGLYATAANVNVTFTSFESCQNGINLVNCNDLDSKSFMLYNNTFTGFGIGSGVSLTISDGTFSGNTIENFYSGVRFTLCSPTVTKNEIYDNRRFGIFIFGHNAFPQLVLNSKIGGRNNSIINNGSVNTSPSPFPFPDAQIGIMPFGNVYLTGGMNNIHSGQTNTTPQIPCISVSPRTIEIPPLQPTEILIEASSNYWGSEYVSNNFFSLAWNYIIDYTPWAIDPYTDEPGPPPSYSSNEPPSTESILLSNAMFLEDKENFTASIKQYEHVIKKYVDTPEYYVALARLPYVYLKAGLETQPLINTYDDGLLSENTSQKKFFKEMKISTHIKGRNYDTAIALAEEMKAEAQSEDEILLAEIDIAVCNVMKESEGNGKSTHYASETLRNLLSKLNGADDKVEPTGITESVLPTECKLYQNYPNPFNPVTQIKFALKNTSDVKLSVYNISGQKVAELANGTRQSGVHTVDFDGSKLNSGIFYYMLETDNQTLTKKMVLTK